MIASGQARRSLAVMMVAALTLTGCTQVEGATDDAPAGVNTSAAGTSTPAPGEAGEVGSEELAEYVRRSEQFIGRPITVPELGSEHGIDVAFWGLPDYCSPEVVERFEQIGFVGGGLDATSFDRICYFNPEDELRRGGLETFRVNVSDSFHHVHHSIASESAGSDGFYKLSKSKGDECAQILISRESTMLSIGLSHLPPSLSQEETCKRLTSFKRILTNITGGK